MSLISKQDLIMAAGLSKFGFLKKPIAATVMKLVKLDGVNKLYDKLKNTDGKVFLINFLRNWELVISLMKKIWRKSLKLDHLF